jgi:hypothetical protein
MFEGDTLYILVFFFMTLLFQSNLLTHSQPTSNRYETDSLLQSTLEY